MKHYLKILVNNMMYSLSLFSLLLMHIYFLMAKNAHLLHVLLLHDKYFI